jgi:D-psicose/D-tagatose/L-ribulose 3-epimerase
MQKGSVNQMKIGICTSTDNIRAVQEMGFDYIEDNASKIAALTQEDFIRKAELVKSASIPCECFNILFPKTMSLLGAANDQTKLESYLELTFSRLQKLSGKIVVFGSGKARNRPENMSFAAAYHQLVFVTRTIGTIAKKYGITVVIEPLNRSETNMICSVAEGAMLMADADLDSVRLLADVYHMQVENESLENIARVGALSHVHIAAKQGRAYPLAPEEPFKDLFKQLSLIGYNGRVSIEGKTTDFEHDAPAALKVLRGLAL